MTITWLILIIFIRNTINPVKTRIALIILRITTFYIINERVRNSWAPLIFLLIFTGGILIIFIILSSLLPNEKSLKIKPIPLLAIISIPLTTLIRRERNLTRTVKIKWFLQSSWTLIYTIILILAYFLSFIYTLSKNNQPIRSTSCYSKFNFVN